MPHKQFKISIGILFVTIAIFLLAGTLLFSALEGWSILDALYFVTMTATTVGYGDYVPLTSTGKIFTIIYSMSIVPIVLYAFSVIARYNVELVAKKINRLESKQHKQEIELEETSKRLTKQKRKLKEQEQENIKQEKQIKSQKRKLEKQEKVIEETTEEIGIVEDVVESVIEEASESSAKKKK